MKAPAFQFYPDDFVGGTIDMTAEDKGAYMMLICYQWGKGSIPKDKSTIDRVAGCIVSEAVLAKFKSGKNPRLEAERIKQQQWRDKSRIGGQKSAEKRWGKGGYKMVKECLPPNCQPNVNSPSPSPSPSPIKQIVAGATGEHKAFIEGWSSNYKSHFGFDYAFNGGRDGKSVKEILSKGILRIDLLELAKAAWGAKNQFYCKQASTIHGFNQSLNQIRVELNGLIKKEEPVGGNF